MILFPAIDLYGGQAVRLTKGDYARMTVYDGDPAAVALKFREAGAEAIHLVDLAAARDGTPPDLETATKIKQVSGLYCELGGGIRSMETIERCLEAGVDRVILGTAAVENRPLLEAAAKRYGERVAVGADLREGMVAVKGWTETTGVTAESFLDSLREIGVKAVICTDISRDGAMRGTNLALYRSLARDPDFLITASGGVSSLEDVRALAQMGVHAAIIGKAYYEGAIDLKEAIEVAKC